MQLILDNLNTDQARHILTLLELLGHADECADAVDARWLLENLAPAVGESIADAGEPLPLGALRSFLAGDVARADCEILGWVANREGDIAPRHWLAAYARAEADLSGDDAVALAWHAVATELEAPRA